MNPLLNDVPGAFARVRDRPRSIAVDRKGVVFPKGGHFQGIQRLQGAPARLVLTSSSDSEAYLVVCNMAADFGSGRATAPVRLAVPPLNHAGGCQADTNFLAVGVEDDSGKRQSEIQFWNLTGAPSRIEALTIRRSGREEVSTAGATGVSSRGNGMAMAVATWNAGTIDFYSAAGDPFRNAKAKFALLRTWTKAGADKSGWIDKNVGEYQSVNLLTQRDGNLFLVAFNRSGDDDWMDLFAVDLNAPAPSMLRKIAKKHMYCTNGVSFRYGAGIWAPSAAGFEVYAVRGDSGDHATGTTIQINHF
jgi:hypothetical protein